jgi:cytochrome c-type biogenesis protein CcmF
VGGSLTLYAFRASNVASFSRFSFYSRETALLTANIILVVSSITVLLGTVYPLIIDAAGLGKISVGAPYFNAVFVPMMSLLFVLMGIGPLIRWKKAKQGELRKHISKPSVLSIILGITLPTVYDGQFNLMASFGLTLAFWVALVVIQELLNQTRAPNGGFSLARLNLSQWGMTVAHLGIAVTITGITIVSSYEKEISVKMYAGSSVEMSGYTINFNGIKNVKGPNYSAQQGQIEVYQDDAFVALLTPERRTYLVQTMGMTEAGIDGGLFRDVYVALGDPLPDGAWAVRVHYKPFVRWIWLGAILMGLGGFLAMLDKRYRLKKLLKSTNTSSVTHKKATRLVEEV